jgi:predicted transcriptional regulator
MTNAPSAGSPLSEARKKIFFLVLQNPGVNLIKIAEELHMELSSAQQYLTTMEESGELRSVDQNGVHTYFIKRLGKETRSNKTQKTHAAISSLLSKNPGLYLSEIATMLHQSPQLTEYHLQTMEKNNVLLGVKEEGEYYRRYYLKNDTVGIRDKRLVSLLRQEHLFKIILVIMKQPGIRHKDLSEYIEVDPSTLTHHISRLKDYDLIDTTTDGKEKQYRIKNKKEIMSIVRRRVSAMITDSFEGIWKDLNLRK